MAINVVTQVGSAVPLTNSVRAQYIEEYLNGAMPARLYDQLATPIANNAEMSHGTSVQVPFLSDMAPGTAPISEIADIIPQALRDAAASITTTSRGEATQASEKLLLTTFTPYQAEVAKRVGLNMMETIDSLARDAATQGSLLFRDANVARSSLDAGSTSHRADELTLLKASGTLQTLKVPGYKDPVNGGSSWAAIMHPLVYHDILRSGNVLAIGQYQNQRIILNHELGSVHGFRLVVSPWAKVFYGAGAANAKSVATEVKNDVNALSKTLVASLTTSVENGAFLNVIDTLETGDTHVSTNERVKYVSHSGGTTITFVGEGANGGLRFSHVGGTALLTNNDSVYTIVLGGPESLAKVYSPEIGEYGQIVGPKRDGLVDQFVSLGWKWYGGYGRFRENGLARIEVSVSAEA